MPGRIRILHLEDNAGDAVLVRSFLEAEGLDYEISQVHNREAFVAALEQGGFDLILSDYALPSFDGISALRLTRERDPDLPFILVSGTMGEELAVETLKGGATDYVLKERISRLGSSVRRALEEARERQERKRAEQALRDSEEKYRSIVETTNEWIWAMSLDGRLTYSNPATEAILGYPPGEMVGKGVLPYIHPEDHSKMEELLAESFAKKQGWNGFTLRWRHRDGSYRSLESNAAPILDEKGEVTGYRGADRDITERVSLEHQLRQSQKMEAVGTLAGGVAHDFNNLLTTILGYSDFLLEKIPEGALREDVEEIKKAGQRAASLTRQLLAFSRKQVLNPVVFSLNTIVSDLEKMLRRIIGEDIDLVTVTGEVGSVRADPGQMEQVIVNLAVNARDAMPRGGKLTIETRNFDLDEEYVRQHSYVRAGAYVGLAVSDTGTGMDPETKARIFEPFFTTKPAGSGTGLGLSMVYGIIKQSGGSIEVYSELGRGTSFKVLLPRISAAGEQEVVSAVPRAAGGSETILLVEDEASVRGLAKRALLANGYKVLEAGSAEEALGITDKYSGPIHLLLTDTVMPGASGPEMARRIAASRPDTRVLFISGYTDDAIVRHGLLKPTEAFLQKPFGPEALTRRVREILDAPLG